jgi:hypothetical protein
MKKFKSYVAIDKEDKAFVYYFQSEASKSHYPEDEYYIYEVTSLKQLYQLLMDLGYDDEYFENFVGHRLTPDEHLDLASRDYE